MNLMVELRDRLDEADKTACLDTIREIIRISNLARRQGILALETEGRECENMLMQIGFLMIADGREPGDVARVFENLIIAGDFRGTDLLMRLIISEGILRIQTGENPRFLVIRLLAMLGEDFLIHTDEIMEYAAQSMENIDNTLQIISRKALTPQSAAFEHTILTANRHALFHILSGTQHHTLVAALSGCSISAIYKIGDCVSINTYENICEDILRAAKLPPDYVQQAQDMILARIEMLRARGEII
ncbi:MAG: hypothetical protein FWB71_03955 [Defluviitaleaceae bacterium]|nr:hypothetical protein [Defluviitaleaceae bacterium]